MSDDNSRGFFRNLVGRLGTSRTDDGGENGKESLFERLKKGLSRTREELAEKIDTLVHGRKRIDAATLEELEEILISADIGVQTTLSLIRRLEERLKRNELSDGEALKRAIGEELLNALEPYARPLETTTAAPFVIMVIGVNGVGKTTTIGKLASLYRQQGKKVLLAAADTFRAAATEQLLLWGERCGVDVIRHREGADPAAVVFDACRAAVARGVEILIIDTAGRLHTKVNLMEELKKIFRVTGREIAGAPHETLLVLDAATGQNALNQARLFREAAPVSGVIMTKLDGSAKGGVLIPVCVEHRLPIRFIGVGERIDDLRPFDAREYVNALLG